jgi:PKD repeat protein
VVNFSSAGSSDPDGVIASYSWSFGDSTSGSGPTVSHTYTAAGTYTARLTVTDNSGLTGTTSVSVVVTGAPPPPPPPATKYVAVSDITMSLYRYYSDYYAGAKVTIKDQDGKVVPNAIVKGTWSGLVSGTYSGKTNSSGVVQLYSPSSRWHGTFTFKVTGVTLTGYIYDPSKNKETSDSISR